MSSSSPTKTNNTDYIRNRQVDKERHLRLAEAMDEAVKILEEASDTVRQGEWDEKLHVILSALESKEKPSIPFALGSLGLESVPEALGNDEYREGRELFQKLLAQGVDRGKEDYLQADEELNKQILVSPRRQRTRLVEDSGGSQTRWTINLEHTLYPRLRHILTTITQDKISVPFRKPVTLKEAPDYHDVIAHPMDLRTMRNKLDRGTYKHAEEFRKDFLLICENAFRYNAKGSDIHELAKQMKKLCKELIDPVVEEWSNISVEIEGQKNAKEPDKEPAETEEDSIVVDSVLQEPLKKSKRTNRKSEAPMKTPKKQVITQKEQGLDNEKSETLGVEDFHLKTEKQPANSKKREETVAEDIHEKDIETATNMEPQKQTLQEKTSEEKFPGRETGQVETKKAVNVEQAPTSLNQNKDMIDSEHMEDLKELEELKETSKEESKRNDLKKSQNRTQSKKKRPSRSTKRRR
eukprot:jgi/Galph1/3498/GphlegSOOS_G2174.1